jgi:hypothetical protein
MECLAVSKQRARVRPPNSMLGQNLERGRKFNISVYSVTSTHGSFCHPNPVLHGVPLFVIPNQQIPLRAVGALDRALVVRVDLAIL